MEDEITRGQSGQYSAASTPEFSAVSGWVTTKQAARSLGISPRTVRWHIEQGNIVAEPQGEGVQRTWLVSIDSLQAFRHVRQHAKELPVSDRAETKDAAIAPDIGGSPIRELADRLAEEAARAAEYRVRLELTEQAQSTLEGELAAERQRREAAERERDELAAALEAARETRESSVEVSEGMVETKVPPESGDPVQRRSWWKRFFGFE
jgi:molybdenum-dependent DNA-binding transcriptional regulator ModE